MTSFCAEVMVIYLSVMCSGYARMSTSLVRCTEFYKNLIKYQCDDRYSYCGYRYMIAQARKLLVSEERADTTMTLHGIRLIQLLQCFVPAST